MSLLIDATATALDASAHENGYCCERCEMTHDEMVAEWEKIQREDAEREALIWADMEQELLQAHIDAREEYDALVKEGLEEEEALHWQYFMDGV